MLEHMLLLYFWAAVILKDKPTRREIPAEETNGISSTPSLSEGWSLAELPIREQVIPY